MAKTAIMCDYHSINGVETDLTEKNTSIPEWFITPWPCSPWPFPFPLWPFWPLWRQFSFPPSPTPEARKKEKHYVEMNENSYATTVVSIGISLKLGVYDCNIVLYPSYELIGQLHGIPWPIKHMWANLGFTHMFRPLHPFFMEIIISSVWHGFNPAAGSINPGLSCSARISQTNNKLFGLNPPGQRPRKTWPFNFAEKDLLLLDEDLLLLGPFGSKVKMMAMDVQQ